jgi:predicted oxidoreductase
MTGDDPERANDFCWATPNHNPALVEQVILEEIVEQHPARLTIAELTLRIAANPDDRVEVETIAQAIRDLRRSGLVRYRDDEEVIEATFAALRAATLLRD